MVADGRAPRLAVLIDADNASAKIAPVLFAEIAKIGEASVRRLYGDFSTPRMQSWRDVSPTFAIIEHHNRAHTSGKNASDIALVIDAMDLLHSGRLDGFCLVSSDSDFTALAARIREEGVDVFGFGEQKTPLSFRQACKRFIYTENLLPGTADTGGGAEEKTQPSAIQPLTAATALIRTAIAQLEGEDGWVMLANVGNQLTNLAPDFDPRSYGKSKLSDLVMLTGGFEMRREEGRGMFIRLKPVPAKSGGKK
jgi:uncharacterized LabA/DUF88 family protein